MLDLIQKAEAEHAKSWRPPQAYIQRSDPGQVQAIMAAGIRGGQGLAPNLAAVKGQPVQQAQVQQAGLADIRADILKLKALIQQKINAEQRQPQPVRRPVQKAQARPAGYQAHMSKQGYRPTPASGYQAAQPVYSVRDIVRRSVGLPPEQAKPAPKLPVSPITGQPSALRAMIERSVGIK